MMLNVSYNLVRVSEKRKEHSPCCLLISIRGILTSSLVETYTKTQNVVWLETNILHAFSVLYSMLLFLLQRPSLAVNILN